MADIFDCLCGEVDCLGRSGGASELPVEVLQRHSLSPHIREAQRSGSREPVPATGPSQFSSLDWDADCYSAPAIATDIAA
jgi:hypothetical protein